jgi:hypothetical protein
MSVISVIILVLIILLTALIFSNNMNNTKTTAADFFIYLGVLIGLYASVISLINLLFTLINKWLPDINTSYYYYDFSSTSIRLAIAVLVIFFPAFMYLSRISTKAIVLTPEKKEIWVRRWFSFLTLFIAGLTIAIDLATLVYRFIGGEDLTLRFVLKVLVVLVIAGVVFRYYLSELRRDFTLPTPRRKYFAYATWLIVVIVIALGIVSIGSPVNQRNIRFDQQRINDLQNIQYQITNYWQQKGILPKEIGDLRDDLSGFVLPLDPETNTAYIYDKDTDNSFKLCATFKTADSSKDNSGKISTPLYEGKNISDVWSHQIGYTCFTRTIDKDLYPVRLKI